MKKPKHIIQDEQSPNKIIAKSLRKLKDDFERGEFSEEELLDLPKGFRRFRIELQEITNGKVIPMFGLPINEKEFDKFLFNRYDIQKLTKCKGAKRRK